MQNLADLTMPRNNTEQHLYAPHQPQEAKTVEQTRGQRQTGRNDLPDRVRELLNGW